MLEQTVHLYCTLAMGAGSPVSVFPLPGLLPLHMKLLSSLHIGCLLTPWPKAATYISSPWPLESSSPS